MEPLFTYVKDGENTALRKYLRENVSAARAKNEQDLSLLQFGENCRSEVALAIIRGRLPSLSYRGAEHRVRSPDQPAIAVVYRTPRAV